MSYLLTFWVGIIACFVIESESNWSVFTCPGVDWIVQRNDSKIQAKFLYQWLDAWQSDCSSKKTDIGAVRFVGGISNNLQWMLRDFASAIEINTVYRPVGEWFWADVTQSQLCTLSLPSYDCFFKPISVCGFPEENQVHVNTSAIKATIKMIELPDGERDVCSIGRKLKKSIQWVHAHLLNYFMQPNELLASVVTAARKEVFGGDRPGTILAPDRTATMSVCLHIRGGRPDNGRRPGNITRYVEVVDSINVDAMKMYGKRVGLVFITSDLVHENAVSAAEMTRRFPRKYSYSVLQRSISADVHEELEYYMKRNQEQWIHKDKMVNSESDSTRDYSSSSSNKHHSSSTDKNFGLMHSGFVRNHSLEFFVDVELLATCDYFVGAYSSVYAAVTGLRLAREVGPAYNSSCFIETRLDHEPLVCEGSEDSRHFWKAMSSGYDSPHSSFMEYY